MATRTSRPSHTRGRRQASSDVAAGSTTGAYAFPGQGNSIGVASGAGPPPTSAPGSIEDWMHPHAYRGSIVQNGVTGYAFPGQGNNTGVASRPGPPPTSAPGSIEDWMHPHAYRGALVRNEGSLYMSPGAARVPFTNRRPPDYRHYAYRSAIVRNGVAPHPQVLDEGSQLQNSTEDRHPRRRDNHGQQLRSDLVEDNSTEVAHRLQAEYDAEFTSQMASMSLRG